MEKISVKSLCNYIFLMMLLLIVFAGCAKFSSPTLYPYSRPDPQLDSRWYEYGAYYLVDELFIETSSKGSKIVINKQLFCL